MKTIVFALTIGFIAFSSLLGSILVYPNINELENCYQRARTTFSANEQKKANEYWDTQTTCLFDKTAINDLLSCQNAVRQRKTYVFFTFDLAETIAQKITKTKIDVKRLVDDHNDKCSDYPNTQINN